MDRTYFHELAIGDKFHSGIYRSIDGLYIIQYYKKTTKSKAECIDRLGYDNTIAIGTTKSFSSFCTIYPLEDELEFEEELII